MKFVLVLSLVLLSVNYSKAQIKDLSGFQWENRLLVIYADNDQALQAQIQKIRISKDEFLDRELLVIILKDGKLEIWNSDLSHQLNFQSIINELDIDQKMKYQNILIGKDGGVKLRMDGAISNDQLFNTIDAMPMRKREMKSDH